MAESTERPDPTLTARRPGTPASSARAPRAARNAKRPAAGVEPETRRVVIENVRPRVDDGRLFPAKRSVGQTVEVQADIFADGHDHLAAALRYRHVEDETWQEIPMRAEGNDLWTAPFTVQRLGRYEFSVTAWVDHFDSWRGGLEKKVEAGQDVSSELLEGAELVRQAAARAATVGGDAALLHEHAEILAGPKSVAARAETAASVALAELMARYPDRSRATEQERSLAVLVDAERATWGAWYEMFPRSCGASQSEHGTFADCEARLPYVAGMGFDVLYLPPIHPIGLAHRKGPNNTPGARPEDPGSPWAIGAPQGGHTAVHPRLGTLDDFTRLVAKARQHGLEIALDIAFQCSPDHPWVSEHPDWFRWRPDGTIQYAENPPKKYQDIYPLNFETPSWRELWEELKNVFLFWAERGVRIFRVDNPHTKPFRFWHWAIAEVQRAYPDAVFLSEAFTRPKILRHLAKVGFSQSYTYFTWRNTKHELVEYFTELAQGEAREYLRPNLFANTPDILHEFLQHNGRAGFQIRLVLAATLAGSYGIYGPAFELCEGRALRPGSEEYLDSEKYQIRHWDIDRPDSLRELITRINGIRRSNAAFRHDASLRWVPVDNDQLLCFSKRTPDRENIVLVVVNLDPHRTQAGTVNVPLDELAIGHERTYQVHDLISDARYTWKGAFNYVALDPHVMPAHVFRVRIERRAERDFEHYA
jgi:starch synthase (maltosyl-transferring)